jgi:hypothetical protein
MSASSSPASAGAPRAHGPAALAAAAAAAVAIIGGAPPAGSVADTRGVLSVYVFDAAASVRCVIDAPKERVLDAITNAEGTATLDATRENVVVWRRGLLMLFLYARAKQLGLTLDVLPRGAMLAPKFGSARSGKATPCAASERDAAGAWVVREDALDVYLQLTCCCDTAEGVACSASLRLSLAFADAAAAARGERETVPVHCVSFAPAQTGSGGAVARAPQPCVHLQGVAAPPAGRTYLAAVRAVAALPNLTPHELRQAGLASVTGACARETLPHARTLFVPFCGLRRAQLNTQRAAADAPRCVCRAAEDISAGNLTAVVSPAASRQQAKRAADALWQRPGGVAEVIKELHILELTKPGRSPANLFTGPVHTVWPRTYLLLNKELAELFHRARATHLWALCAVQRPAPPRVLLAHAWMCVSVCAAPRLTHVAHATPSCVCVASAFCDASPSTAFARAAPRPRLPAPHTHLRARAMTV